MRIKVYKILIILSILFFISSIFPNKVFCDWVSSAEDFIAASTGEDIGINYKKLDKASDDIFNMLSSVGMIIAVIVGVILGIIFMAASANDKAKVKEALIPYFVGCVVIFGAFTIWKIAIQTFNGI